MWQAFPPELSMLERALLNDAVLTSDYLASNIKGHLCSESLKDLELNCCELF
jgi:hypothetical protein